MQITKKTTLGWAVLQMIMIMLLSGCMPVQSQSIPISRTVAPCEVGTVYKEGEKDENFVEMIKVNNRTWVFTSYANLNGKRTPANGMLVETAEGIVLVDTPWSKIQTESLMTLVQAHFKHGIQMAIITHAHQDRMGGYSVLVDHKIKTNCSPLTAQLANERGFGKMNGTLEEHEVFSNGGVLFEIIYPGEGHSKDNIVVYLPSQKVLFAGCFIKGLEANDLGNVKEANLVAWPKAIDKMQKLTSEAEIVIPGHGAVGDQKLIDHTLKLLKKNATLK